MPDVLPGSKLASGAELPGEAEVDVLPMMNGSPSLGDYSAGELNRLLARQGGSDDHQGRIGLWIHFMGMNDSESVFARFRGITCGLEWHSSEKYTRCLVHDHSFQFKR